MLDYKPSLRQQAQALLELRRRQRQATNPRLGLLDWTRTNRAMLVPARPFIAYPHLSPIYNDDAKDVVIYKAAQLGASEYLLSWILWAADVLDATGLYLFPTDTHVSDFSAARLGPAIEKGVSPYLARIVGDGGGLSEGAAAVDRVALKRVGQRFVYFRGARVSKEGKAPQLRSIDGDALAIDELDEMDVRAPALASKRLLNSKYARTRWVSTPTYAGVGIHAEYQQSDRRQWFIPCLACGRRHAPTLDDLVLEWDALERPVRWNLTPAGAPFLRCPNCGGSLDRDSGAGEWVAEYPQIERHGYHLFRLSLPGKPLTDVLAGLDLTNESKRQQFINQDLGLPFRSASAQSLTDEILRGAMREYGMGVVAKERCYAGIDVGRLLHIEIRGEQVKETGERPLRWAGTVSSFEDATKVINYYNVKICVVDGEPETREARKFQAASKRMRVWLADYAGAHGAPTKKKMLGIWNPREGMVLIDRTRAMDETLTAFQAAANPRDGDEVRNTLPSNIDSVRDYFAQLKAPQRIVKKDEATGDQTAVYLETGPDHHAHSSVFAFVAYECPYQGGWASGATG